MGNPLQLKSFSVYNCAPQRCKASFWMSAYIIMSRLIGIKKYKTHSEIVGLLMSLALPYAHRPPIFTFLTLPIEPDYTTVTTI